jgi:hypothetical protein
MGQEKHRTRRLAVHAEIKNKTATLRSVKGKVAGEEFQIGGFKLLMHKRVSEICQGAGIKEH